MQGPDAERLAREVKETWSLGPSLRIWVANLKLLKHDQVAWQTYRHFAKHHHGDRLGLADYLDEYERRKPTSPPEPNECATCPGDGWITTEFVHRGNVYRGVEPCPDCKAGATNQAPYHHALKTRTW